MCLTALISSCSPKATSASFYRGLSTWREKIWSKIYNFGRFVKKLLAAYLNQKLILKFVNENQTMFCFVLLVIFVDLQTNYFEGPMKVYSSNFNSEI